MPVAKEKEPEIGGVYQEQERRFLLPDLNEKGIWLVNRLKERFPNSNEGELVNWLRGICVQGSNEFLFIRTHHAVALAQVVREALVARPIVVENFVLVDGEEYLDEGGWLYFAIKQWALGLGAVELRVENFTDLPREMIKKRLGTMFKREQVFIKL